MKIYIFFLILLVNNVFVNAQNNNCSPKQPILMILPSDNMLLQIKCLEEIKDRNYTMYVPRYDKALVESTELRFIIAGINGKFADRGFPLESLEERIKEVNFKTVVNSTAEYQDDPKTQLFSAARPDILIEITYNHAKGILDNQLSFIIEAKDSYNKKVIAAIANPGMETLETNTIKLISEQVENNINNFQEKIQRHFEDIKANGRIIPLRVNLDKDTTFKLDDDCGDEEYNEVIRTIVGLNSIKSSFNLIRTTSTEMLFNNIRIPLCDEKGLPLDGRGWANKFRKELEKRCGIKAKNETQGLGDVAVVLKNK